jgi:hypothetical protein
MRTVPGTTTGAEDNGVVPGLRSKCMPNFRAEDIVVEYTGGKKTIHVDWCHFSFFVSFPRYDIRRTIARSMEASQSK